MTKNITISFTIPLSDIDWGGPSIIFYQWLPENDSEVISLQDDSKEIKVFIDKSCVSNLGEVTDELIKSWVNITVTKFKVEVTLKNIQEDLANFIYDERESPRGIHHGLNPEDKTYDILQDQYKRMGTEVVKNAISTVNRIISYARNIKGQYWLTELKFNEKQLNGLNVGFRAKSKLNNGEWFRWCPPSIDQITVHLQSDELPIKQADWVSVDSYVRSNNRPNLIFELLANSKYLFSNDHMRSSVIEAVTALEVSVSNFGSNPDLELLSTNFVQNRIDMTNIGNQIKHLGFSGSIRYLIPLLFSDKILPHNVLLTCYKALEVRNNVVHQGQRNVSSNLVEEVLRGVSFCCTVLDEHTKK